MPHRSDLEAAHARIGALERELAAARGARDQRPASARPVPIPPGFEITETADRVRIAWNAPDKPWPRPARAFIALCLPLALVLAVREGQLLSLCITGIIIGVAMLTTIGGRAVVELSGGRFRIAGSAAARRDHRALWACDIEELYCVLHHGDDRASYELWSVLVGGERVCLVRAIGTDEQARFLEQELERRLRISR